MTCGARVPVVTLWNEDASFNYLCGLYIAGGGNRCPIGACQYAALVATLEGNNRPARGDFCEFLYRGVADIDLGRLVCG